MAMHVQGLVVEAEQAANSASQLVYLSPPLGALGGSDAPSAPPEPTQAAEGASSSQAASQEANGASAFECNVCLELAKEPVVTLCGHLYCWPCLYRWTQTQNCAQGSPGVACPVCKAALDINKVIPIYGRGCDFDPREALRQMEPVPRRPAGQRPSHPQIQQHQQSLTALLGFSFGHTGLSDPLTPEQQHQAFLSRLLLMLGSFVIMCLLLF